MLDLKQALTLKIELYQAHFSTIIWVKLQIIYRTKYGTNINTRKLYNILLGNEDEEINRRNQK